LIKVKKYILADVAIVGDISFNSANSCYFFWFAKGQEITTVPGGN
jgi:hypothetical protein